MFRSFLAAIVYLMMADEAFAVSTDACPTLANGQWVISSIRPMGISGLSYEEAKGYIGKSIFVSDRRLAFNGRSCRGATKSVIRSVGEILSEPGFPYQVLYTCPGGDDSLMPVIYVGNACNKALVAIEGVTFVLRKRK